MLRVRIAFFALVFVAATSCARGERDITIGEDGTLGGVPGAFGGTSLYVNGLGESSPTIVFKSGPAVNALPNCVTTVIGGHAIDHISASGSWDHDESVFPHFVRVDLFEGYRERYDYIARVEIMFDLKTTEIIDIRRFVRLTDRQGERMEELKFPAGCSPMAARPN